MTLARSALSGLQWRFRDKGLFYNFVERIRFAEQVGILRRGASSGWRMEDPFIMMGLQPHVS